MLISKELDLTKGVEFWFAHYYDVFSPCLELESIDKFCEYIKDKFNNVDQKKELCTKLHGVVFRHFSPKTKKGELLVNDCLKNDVEYKHKEKYIKFPDFKVDFLESFTFRIDINPCMVNKGKMTKIYCNAVYPEKISSKNSLLFLQHAKEACEEIVNIITENYVQYFNQFLRLQFSNSDKIELDIENMTPYKLMSCVAGSNDDSSKRFNSSSKDEVLFKSNALTLDRQRKIAGFLRDLSSIIEPSWKLEEYHWETKEVSYSEGHDESAKVNGYLGFKGDQNKGVFLGLADDTPRTLLLPMHINIIHAN